MTNYKETRKCREQLQLLRALDFAIQETVLYLDAYPNHAEALQYYHALTRQREETLAAYEQTCGPMTIYGNQSATTWDWVTDPWPWEPDAN